MLLKIKQLCIIYTSIKYKTTPEILMTFFLLNVIRENYNHIYSHQKKIKMFHNISFE